MKESATKQAWLAALAVIAALAPFAGKAFSIDEPLFVWMARWLSRYPHDPYGFSVNWYATVQPVYEVMENPPLGSYYAALIGSVLGWSEVAMHIGFLAPAIAAILGTFFLARRLSGSPLLAALLTLFTPVFLVSATSVMCDVWLLALWVWSIECWLRALQRNVWWLYLISSILATAAALTKYFGLSLVPLLLVFTLVHDRRLTLRLLFLLLPLFAMAWYEAISKARYGHGLFSNAVFYPWTQRDRPGKHLFKPLLTGLSFTGGCFLSCLFFAPLFRRRLLLLGGTAVFIVFLPIFYFVFASEFSSKLTSIAVTTEGALFVTAGIGILALAVADLLQRRTAESALLFLWVVGTFVFASLLNWSVTSRALLPIAPAVAILLIRYLSATGPSGAANIPWWPLLPAAVLSLLIVRADYQFANTARTASRRFQDEFHRETGTVWFEGHWGFQYYMQLWKAKPVDVQRGVPLPGDVLILPFNNTNFYRLPGLVLDSTEHVTYEQPCLATMSAKAGAGFYSSVHGPLPWVFTDVPPERYEVQRLR